MTEDPNTVRSPAQAGNVATATPLRLQLDPNRPAEPYLDGAWWPRSTELPAELPALLAELSAQLGSIGLVGYHRDAWNAAPDHLDLTGHPVHLQGFVSPDPPTLVVIADTVPAPDRDRISHQRLDQDALARPVAKAVLTLGGSEPERSAGLAVRLAAARPPGPVVVNVDAHARHDGAAAREPGGRETDAAAGYDLAPLAAALREARRLVVLLGADAIAQAGAVRAALAGSNVPALHTYRSRGVMPDCSAEAAGLFTGGTMEWPLLSAADLIAYQGVGN